MRQIVDGARFVTEVAVLVTIAVAGADIAWPLVVVLPAALALVWGRWVAPKASLRLADPPRFLVEAVLFLTAGALAAESTSPVLGLVLASVGVATSVAARLRHQAPTKHTS